MQVDSRLLVALASLVLNLGARHLPSGLSPRMQALTSSGGMRTLVVCALFYLSTRDVMLSIALAFVFFAVMSTLLNEESRYAVIHGGRHFRPLPLPLPLPLPHPLPVSMTITRDVYDAAVDTVLAFRRQSRASEPVPVRP